METFLTVLHLSSALFMILVVLLQAGKGAGMGAAFGGSTQAALGSSGGMSFLGKMTAGAATVFMITSMSLAYISSTTSSMVDSVQSSAEDKEKAEKDKQTGSAEKMIPISTESGAEAEAVIPGKSGKAPVEKAPGQIIFKDKDGKPIEGIKIKKVAPSELPEKIREKAMKEKGGPGKSGENPAPK